MCCLDNDTIIAFLARTQSPDSARQVERHLACCAACRRLVAKLIEAEVIEGASDSADATDADSTQMASPLPDTRPLPASDQETDLGAGGFSHAPSCAPGDVVDHYRIVRRLGRGGVGEVYLARDVKLGRAVALKLIRPESMSSPEMGELFLREARITAQLDHPNMITIFELGRHRGVPYLALEYLAGRTLKMRLAEGRLLPTEAARVGLEVADALRAAHAADVLHQDLKPQNIWLADDGRVRVLDLGLARCLSLITPAGEARGDDSVDQLEVNLSVSGGTPAYMAPEQWRHEPTTPAVDIWALGVMLFELVSGHRPYRHGGSRRLVLDVCSDEPVPRLLDSVDPGERTSSLTALSALVGHCLEKDPRSRPSAVEVIAGLRSVLRPDRSAEATEPYLGLSPFAERDERFFLGRQREVALAVGRLRSRKVLTVVGPSGVGKSSLVSAGIVPRLRELGPTAVVSLRPGRRPFDALADALLQRARSTPYCREEVAELAARLATTPLLLAAELDRLADAVAARVVVCVDQLEELCTLASEADRHGFMQALGGAAADPLSETRVLLTVRHEFLGQLDTGEDEQRLIAEVMVLQPPSQERLRRIIEGPAGLLGYRFDDVDLPGQMAEEVVGEAACLPLLQFTAQLLWDARDTKRRLLLRSAYEAFGGVAGALARHAEGILAGMSGTQIEVVRTLLLRLVTPQRTRRVVSTAELCEGLPAASVLEPLINGRLLSVRRGVAATNDVSADAAEGEVELAHESLISSWGRLSRWLEESHQDQRFLTEIGQAARLWLRRGERVEELWQGNTALEANLRLERCSLAVPEVVRRFAAAGRRHALRRSRFKRAALGAGFSLLLVATLALIVMTSQARRQRNIALAQERNAAAQRRVADNQRSAAQREGARAALRAGQEDLLAARAKLRAALETRDSTEARALWWQLAQRPLVWQRRSSRPVYAAALVAGGSQIAVANGVEVQIVDLHTRRVARTLRGHDDVVLALATSADGRSVASAAYGTVLVWALPEGRVIRKMSFSDRVWRMAFDRTARRLAVVAKAGAPRPGVHLVDLPRGRPRRLGYSQGSVSFSPGGRLLATAGEHDEVLVYDVGSGQLSATLRGHAGVPRAVTFSPDGRTLAAAGMDPTIRLWDMATRRVRGKLAGHGKEVDTLSFSADGRVLASAGKDRSVRLWDVKSARPLGVLSGHTARILAVSLDAAGKLVLSASMDHTLRLWRTDVRQPAPRLEPPAGWLEGLAIDADGKWIVAAGADGTIRFWDTETGVIKRELVGAGGQIYGLALARDGKALASGDSYGRLVLWDLDRGEVSWSRQAGRRALTSVSISPDGATVAAAGDNESVSLWDAASGRRVRALRLLRSHAVDFGRRGAQLAAGGQDNTVRIWNADSGTLQQTLRGHGDRVHDVVFGGRDQLLASSSMDEKVRIWRWRAGRVWREWSIGARPYGLAFSADGTALGLAAADGTIRLYSLRSGRSDRIRGHRGEANALAFAPGGGWLASVGDDGTVRRWRVADGRPLWRAPLLMVDPPLTFSHRGWSDPATGRTRDRSHRKSWQTRVESAARIARAATVRAAGQLCIVTHDGTLELWHVGRDLRLWSKRREVDQLEATRLGCVIRRGDRVVLHRRDGVEVVLARDSAQVLSLADDRILVLRPAGAHLFRSDGTSRRLSVKVHGSVVSGTVAGPWLVMGHREGNVELYAMKDGRPRRGFALQDAAASAIVRLGPGPAHTLFVGYANGEVGMWSLATGERLAHERLHGAVVHLARHETRLYLGSDLGDHRVWNLEPLYVDYCALVRRIWARVPVTWRDGQAVLTGRPKTHRCLKATRRKAHHDADARRADQGA